MGYKAEIIGSGRLPTDRSLRGPLEAGMAQQRSIDVSTDPEKERR